MKSAGAGELRQMGSAGSSSEGGEKASSIQKRVSAPSRIWTFVYEKAKKSVKPGPGRLRYICMYE
jgi:hypothetical protein